MKIIVSTYINDTLERRYEILVNIKVSKSFCLVAVKGPVLVVMLLTQIRICIVLKSCATVNFQVLSHWN